MEGTTGREEGIKYSFEYIELKNSKYICFLFDFCIYLHYINNELGLTVSKYPVVRPQRYETLLRYREVKSCGANKLSN